MSIFADLRNECLIRELCRETNTDVLLFGFDGFIYFGNIQGIEDNRIALLAPAIKSDTRDVEILNPGGELRRVDFLRVDLWQIVAKGTAIVSDPIASCPCDPCKPCIPIPDPCDPCPCDPCDPRDPCPCDPTPIKIQRDESEERQESHHLIRQLCRMVGDDVVITTLGGFLFEGTLGAIDGELAILRVEDIFGPATSSSISDDDVRSVVVNLEALTSVSSITC